MADLNIKIARFKFKKLGAINYSLWIMLVKPTTRQSYFCLHVNNAFLIILKNLTITQMLHGCRSDLILKRLVHSKKVSLLVV
jgi:hypothetical protein